MRLIFPSEYGASCFFPFKETAASTTDFKPFISVDTVSTTGHPKVSESFATLIFVPFFLLRSLLLRATTTGIPNSNNCVVKNKLRLKFVASTIFIITSGCSFLT